jgi:Class II flagellar assembly regulator
MRVNGPNGTAVATASAATRRANGAGGLAPSESTGPQTAGATISLRTIGGIDALIALQGIEDPTERRLRRAVKHGRRALDALEELKRALLSGGLESSALLGLKAVAADLKEGSGDDKFDQVLNEIELRVAAELAKAGINQV